MEDDQNYRLIGGDETKNSDEPSDRETAYLLNDCTTTSSQNQVRHSSRLISNNSSVVDLMNNIVNAFDNNNSFSKFIIAALLFHPITNLMIQDNPTVKKKVYKSTKKINKTYINSFYVILSYWILNDKCSRR